MKTQIVVCILVFIIAIPVTGLSEPIRSTDIQINKQYETKSETYIDPAIQLTQKHLFILEKTVESIEDVQIKKFTQEIIKSIEINGKADKNDLLQIIENNLHLNEKIKGIHFLCLLRSDGSGYVYPRGFIPFLYIMIFHEFFSCDSYLGPAFLVEWNSPNADTRINGEKMYENDPQSGYIFGFFGYSFSGGIWPTYFHVVGISVFVIITEYKN